MLEITSSLQETWIPQVAKGVWNFREIPRGIIVKVKIEAAIRGKSVKALLVDLVEVSWQELEKKGLLPKGN